MTDPTTKARQVNAAVDGQTETTTPAAERRRRPQGRRVLRWGLRALAWLAGGLVAAVLALLLVVQTRGGSQGVGEAIIALVNPFEGAAIEVGRIGGNWISTLELHDVNVIRDDTTHMAHVDTLRLRYGLLSLLRKRLHVRRAYIAGPTVTLRQQADSTWDVLNALGLSEPDTLPAAEPGAFVILVDDLRLDDGAVSARFYAPEQDSTLHLNQITTRLGGLALGKNPALRLDTLRAALTPPGKDEPIDTQVRAALADGLFKLLTFRLDPPGSSRIDGLGSLRLPDDDHEAIYDIDLVLHATALALRDLYPFAPTRNATGRADSIGVHVQGTSDLLDVEAEARFADGSWLRLDAEATPGRDDSLAYRLDGTVRGLDPSFFTGDPAAAGRINATLDANLRGPALDSLSGTLNAALFDSYVGEYAPDRTTLRTTFTDGEATIDLNTGLRDANLFADGTLRPLDATPTYDLQVRFDSLDVGRFVEGQTSDLGGTLRLDGSGFDFERADLTATLDFDASRINRHPLTDGVLTARLASGALDFDGRLRFVTDSLTLRGEAHLGDTMRYRIDEVRFDRLNVAALLGDTTSSAFSGIAALHGSGIDPATVTLDEIRLDVAESSFGVHQVKRTNLNGTLRDGRLDLDAQAALDPGSLDIEAVVRPFDERWTYDIQGRFDRLDVGTLAQNPDQSSDLNGTFRLAGSGFEPATMALDTLRLVLSDSQLNEQPIDTTRLNVALQAGLLTFDARLKTPEGTSTLAGSGAPYDETPSFWLTEGRLDNLNVGALLGWPNLDTRLSGSIDTLEVRGVSPQTTTLHSKITLGESIINQETITGGETTITLEDGYARAVADVRLERGRIRLDSLQGHPFDERPTYAAAGSITNVDLGRLSGIDTLDASFSADFEVNGEGIDPATMRLSAGRLAVRNAHYDDVRIGTLETRFSLDDGLLDVDTLYVRSNVATAEGSGPIALFDTAGVHPSNFSLEGDFLDERPLRAYVDAEVFSLGEGLFQGRVSGEPGVLRFTANATVDGIVYNDVRVLEMDVFAAGLLDSDGTLKAADAEIDLSRFSIPTLSTRYAGFRVAYGGEAVDFSSTVTIDNRRDARLKGYVELGEESQRIVLEDLSMHLDDERWALEPFPQETAITYGDSIRISNFMLVEKTQEILIDGFIDPDGEQSLGLTIFNFRIGAVADLLRFPGLDGTLNGGLALDGPGFAPTVRGTLNLDVESRGESVGELIVHVDYDSLRLNLDNTRLIQGNKPRLMIDGYTPLDLRLGLSDDPSEGGPLQVNREASDLESDVAFQVVADSLNIGWIEPFLDPRQVAEVEGILSGAVDVSGTLAEPVLDGEATLGDGRLGLPALGLPFKDIRADVDFAKNQILVHSTELHSGEGRLTVDSTGTIDFPRLTLGELNLPIKADNFRAIDTRDYQATIGGALVLRGTTQRPILGGRLELQSTDIFLTEQTAAAEFGPVELTEEDLQMLERHFGIRVTAADTTTFVLYDALTLEDLTVEMGRDVWLRSPKNPEMNIQFTGNLNLQKEPRQDPQLFGTVRVLPDRSFIKQFGRRFNIVNDPSKSANTLTFNGPTLDPLLDLAADYEVRSRRDQDDDITISLLLRGRLDDLETELQCYDDTRGQDCTLNTADLISYIATGRPAGDAFQGLGGTGRDLALSQLSSLVASAAGEELGLDVIEIDQDGTRGTTVTAGKYLSRRFFASVSWPISIRDDESTTTNAAAQEVTIEYELFNWLLLRMISNGTSIEFNLLYEYAY